MSPTATQKCPQCQASIPVYEGFVPWCEQCEWNVHIVSEEPSASFIDRFYTRMSQKHSNALFESIVRAGVHKPPFSLPIAVAYVLAVGIHLGSVLLFATGCLLIVLGWPYFFMVFAGVLCLGVTWLLRPRFHKKPDGIVPREQFPHLYHIVDSISDYLGTPRVDGIVLDEEFNAAFGRAGLQQQKILWIGLPLWYALANDEKVDLLAHEIAHDVNSDYREGLLVGSAARTLFVLNDVLTPLELWPTDMGILGIAAVPITLLSLGIAHIVRYCALALAHLLWSSSQRAEYYADILAASVGGKRAALGGMNKMLCSRAVETALRSFALQRPPEGTIFEHLQQKLAAIPPSEIERLRRSSLYRAERMDISHPPTGLRLAMIEKFAPNDVALQLPDTLFQAIEEELQPLQIPIQNRIVDKYRASLYR